MRFKLRKSETNPARFEGFKEMKIQVGVFWVVALCSVAVGYQHFGGPYCLHLTAT